MTNVAVQLEFKGDRKEPLGTLVRRVSSLFEASGLQPDVSATFSDGPGGIRSTSAVERALRKHPHLSRFDRTDAPLPGVPATRRLTNNEEAVPFEIGDILALADGVPRSLPFHAVSIRFGHAEFGRIASLAPGLGAATGISIGDSWWVNGRNRSVTGLYVVAAEAASKTLPEAPAGVRAIVAGLGKPKKSKHFVPPVPTAAPGMAVDPTLPVVSAEIALVSPIVAKYRAGMKRMIEQIGLPHDLPPAAEVRTTSLGASGPLKPALAGAFEPRGYDCRGGSGTFTLRRRTRAHLAVDLELDVGTWSRSVTFMFHVRGPGFNATLIPPVTARSESLQYPIGDTANWERIVANIGALVDELERTFVAEIEAAVPPAPAWFDPGR